MSQRITNSHGQVFMTEAPPTSGVPAGTHMASGYHAGPPAGVGVGHIPSGGYNIISEHNLHMNATRRPRSAANVNVGASLNGTASGLQGGSRRTPTLKRPGLATEGIVKLLSSKQNIPVNNQPLAFRQPGKPQRSHSAGPGRRAAQQQPQQQQSISLGDQGAKQVLQQNAANFPRRRGAGSVISAASSGQRSAGVPSARFAAEMQAKQELAQQVMMRKAQEEGQAGRPSSATASARPRQSQQAEGGVSTLAKERLSARSLSPRKGGNRSRSASANPVTSSSRRAAPLDGEAQVQSQPPPLENLDTLKDWHVENPEGDLPSPVPTDIRSTLSGSGFSELGSSVSQRVRSTVSTYTQNKLQELEQRLLKEQELRSKTESSLAQLEARQEELMRMLEPTRKQMSGYVGSDGTPLQNTGLFFSGMRASQDAKPSSQGDAEGSNVHRLEREVQELKQMLASMSSSSGAQQQQPFGATNNSSSSGQGGLTMTSLSGTYPGQNRTVRQALADELGSVHSGHLRTGFLTKDTSKFVGDPMRNYTQYMRSKLIDGFQTEDLTRNPKRMSPTKHKSMRRTNYVMDYEGNIVQY